MDWPTLVNGNEKEVAEATVGMLREVGFDVEPKLWDPSAFSAQVWSDRDD